MVLQRMANVKQKKMFLSKYFVHFKEPHHKKIVILRCEKVGCSLSTNAFHYYLTPKKARQQYYRGRNCEIQRPEGDFLTCSRELSMFVLLSRFRSGIQLATSLGVLLTKNDRKWTGLLSHLRCVGNETKRRPS